MELNQGTFTDRQHILSFNFSTTFYTQDTYHIYLVICNQILVMCNTRFILEFGQRKWTESNLITSRDVNLSCKLAAFVVRTSIGCTTRIFWISWTAMSDTLCKDRLLLVIRQIRNAKILNLRIRSKKEWCNLYRKQRNILNPFLS